MKATGILVAVACAVVVGGCYGSTGQVGHADASADVLEEPGTPSSCGNGTVEAGEECDDGDGDDCNGCTSECTWGRALQADFETPGTGVTVENVPCVPCPFTIEFWFRIDDADGIFTVIDLPGLLTLGVGPGGYEIESITGSGIESWPFGRLSTGTWHHFAYGCWRSEGDAMSVPWHLDGNCGGEIGAHAGFSYSCSTPMRIGSSSAIVGAAHGTVDDVRISNTNHYYYLPFTPERHHGVLSDTVALWQFNKVVDGVVPDVSGNGHDAVLVDGALVQDDCHLP
jgi:cysteine-rich repeat protein